MMIVNMIEAMRSPEEIVSSFALVRIHPTATKSVLEKVRFQCGFDISVDESPT